MPRPSRQSATKTARPSVKVDEMATSEDEFDEFWEDLETTELSEGSDGSEFGKRSGKKQHGKTRKRKQSARTWKPGPAPELPEMSDVEYDRSSCEGSPILGDSIVVRQARPVSATSSGKRRQLQIDAGDGRDDRGHLSSPQILQLHLDNGAANGGTTISLNMSDLVIRKRSYDTFDSPEKSGVDSSADSSRLDTRQPPSKRLRLLRDDAAKARERKLNKKTGFTKLPFEIRVRIYRHVFVSQSPINFDSREDFSRSSAFLRTCRTVYNEGREVLYGENAFHFERSSSLRGTYYERPWKEIGFKDVRRFLHDIGTINMSHMRLISFYFQDATPTTTPYLEPDERRYVNDPVLHHVLRLIGVHARLDKIAFSFSGRKQVAKRDYHFLKALSSIKAAEVVHPHRSGWSNLGRSPRCTDILNMLKAAMTVRRQDDDDVDVEKKKKSIVKMYHEEPSRNDFYGPR